MERLATELDRGKRFLEHHRPERIEALSDRAWEVWAPLVSIADLVGGSWPYRVRDAAEVVIAANRHGELDPGLRLLADVRMVFDSMAAADRGSRIDSKGLVAELQALDAPEYDETPIESAQQLAVRLRPFGVLPRAKWRDGTTCLRGYWWRDFEEQWAHYAIGTDDEFEGSP